MALKFGNVIFYSYICTLKLYKIKYHNSRPFTSMNKYFYMAVSAIRIIGGFFTNSPIIKKIVYYMTARTRGGIAARFWMAVVMSVVALLFDVFFLQSEFDHLPAYVPVLFNIYGDVTGWGHKSMLEGFTEARVAFFMIMVVIGWVLYVIKGRTLMGKRIRLLVVDIANLVITTGVAMSVVYVEIAKGNNSEKLSEEWEYAVMCFWLLILVIEYIADKKHLVEEDEQ